MVNVLVTTTQPQLFPPLYMYSRYARAEFLIFLTCTQHNRGQYMSEVAFQVPGEKRVTGVSLAVTKTGRAGTHECILADNQFVLQCENILRKYPNPEFVQQAVEVLRQYRHSDNLNQAVISSLRSSLQYLGYSRSWARDDSLQAIRSTGSSYISELTRCVGGTQYFQGKTAMSDYFEPDYFDHIELFYQHYDQPDVSPRLSVLHHLAANGLNWVKDRIRPELSVIKPFSRDTV